MTTTTQFDIGDLCTVVCRNEYPTQYGYDVRQHLGCPVVVAAIGCDGSDLPNGWYACELEDWEGEVLWFHEDHLEVRSC